jgi:hypothetical protein
MPSTPASRAARIAPVPWACAVTGRPRRCASSTITVSCSGVNWATSWWVPGVMVPPLAITLMTSTPRSARSRAAARSASGVGSAAPPRKLAVPSRRGDRRSRREDRGQAGGAAQAQREVVTVAEVTHGGYSGVQGGASGSGHRGERSGVVARGERGDRVGARIEREMDVGVDQPGQQGRAGQVHHLGAFRHGSPLDTDDGRAVQHQHRVRDESRGFAVEQGTGPDCHQPWPVGHVCARHAGTVRRAVRSRSDSHAQAPVRARRGPRVTDLELGAARSSGLQRRSSRP